MTTKEVDKVQETVPLAVRQRFAEMALLLPRAEDSDPDEAVDRIIEQVMAATTWEQVNDPWSSGAIDKLVDVPLRIVSASVLPSDYADGLGIYLRVDAMTMTNGEAVAFSTGSVNIVAQLVKLWTLDAFPVFATIRKAKKQSKAGYWPQHLEVTDSGAID